MPIGDLRERDHQINIGTRQSKGVQTNLRVFHNVLHVNQRGTSDQQVAVQRV